MIAYLGLALAVACGGQASPDGSGANGTGGTQVGDGGALAGSGGVGAGGGIAGGGGTVLGGTGGVAGSGGANSCPLDGAQKTIADAIVHASTARADWLSKNTSGTGAGSSRAYGGSVPTTSVAEYGVHKPSGSCTAPLLSDPLCGTKSLGATICVQSGCDAAGIHIVKLWLDNVPFKTPTIIGCCEPDGETTIHEFKSDAKVTETGQSTSGTASLDGGALSAATLTDTIANLLPMPLTAKVDLVTATGTIEYGGSVVATISNDLLTWTGVCANP